MWGSNTNNKNREQALKTKVSSTEFHHCWRGGALHNQRNRAIQKMMRLTPTDFLPSPSKCDRVIWTLSKVGKFMVKSAWEGVTHKNPIQDWHSIVWFSQGAPRWSFIEWLAIWGKLSTCDRLLSWGLSVKHQCVPCVGGLDFGDSSPPFLWVSVFCLVDSGLGRMVFLEQFCILPLSEEVDWAVQHIRGGRDFVMLSINFHLELQFTSYGGTQ